MNYLDVAVKKFIEVSHYLCVCQELDSCLLNIIRVKNTKIYVLTLKIFITKMAAKLKGQEMRERNINKKEQFQYY